MLDSRRLQSSSVRRCNQVSKALFEYAPTPVVGEPRQAFTSKQDWLRTRQGGTAHRCCLSALPTSRRLRLSTQCSSRGDGRFHYISPVAPAGCMCLRNRAHRVGPQPLQAASASLAIPDVCIVEDEQSRRELHSLNVAISANILILVAKTWVHMVTGSSSILAEALHSVADILNQLLLRIGVIKSLQGPTSEFPYGYLRDRFVWSLISAVGIFFLGAGASVFHGLHSLTDTHAIQGVGYTFLVLGVSAVLEGYSLFVAVRNIMEGASARGMTFLEYVKSGVDPTTVAVLMEDGGAILGLAIAGICTALSHFTGSAMWDAVGSIGIGLLLGAIATFLVSKNRQLLIGRSMNKKEIEEVMEILKQDPVVSYVIEAKTEEIGPRIFRFKAEVAWDGELLAGRYLKMAARSGMREQLVKGLRKALDDPDPEVLDKVLKRYGRDIISAVGAEVDRIESEIQLKNPGIRYVDLETDRGRFRPGNFASFDGELDALGGPWAPIGPPWDPLTGSYGDPTSTLHGVR